MNKVTIFFACVGLFIFFIFSAVFCRSGYSEKQRIIYNNVLSDIITSMPRPINTAEYNSYSRIDCFSKDLDNLKEENAPDWKVKINSDFNLLTLPEEGLTFAELIKRAEETHDANVYLYLASRAGLKYPHTFQNHEYPFHFIHNGKKWLQAAIDKGRPGADFLLGVLNIQEKRLFTGLPAAVELDFEHLPTAQDYDYLLNIAGYDAFRELIRQGDFELYKTLQFFEPHLYMSPLKDDMKAALTKQVEKGDKTAKRHLAELNLIPLSKMDITRNIEEEKKGLPTKSCLRWLAMYEMALNSTRELKSLADEGDIRAMYSWLKYGLRFEAKYDVRIWRDIFNFSDILIRKGYADILESVAGISPLERVVFSDFPWGILGRYYSEDSIRKVANEAENVLRERKDVKMAYYSFLFRFDSLTDTELKLWLDESMNPFLRMYGMHRRVLERFTKQEDKKRVVDYLEKQALAGYPEAKLALADIWNRGIMGERNEQKVLSLLEEVWRDCQKYNAELEVYSEVNDTVSWLLRSSTTAEECIVELMELYLSASPAIRNETRAFQLAKEYANYSETGYKSHGSRFFLLGQLYEKGIGIPPDKDKAIACYKQGVSLLEEASSALALVDLYGREGKVVENDIARIAEQEKRSNRGESPTFKKLKKAINSLQTR